MSPETGLRIDLIGALIFLIIGLAAIWIGNIAIVVGSFCAAIAFVLSFIEQRQRRLDPYGWKDIDGARVGLIWLFTVAALLMYGFAVVKWLFL